MKDSMIYQNVLRSSTVVYITGKCSVNDLDIFLDLANRTGRTKDVKYFNPLDKTSNTLNPIALVNGIEPEMELASQIMRVLGSELPSMQERPGGFYREFELSRLLEVCALLSGLGRFLTIKDFYLFLTDESFRKRIVIEGCKKGVPHMKSRVRTLFKKKDTFEGMISRLRPWIIEPMNSKVNVLNPDINIVDLISKGGILYCALSRASVSACANSLGRQIIAQVFGASKMLRRNQVKHPPILFILDEFPDLVPFLNSLDPLCHGRVGFYWAE